MLASSSPNYIAAMQHYLWLRWKQKELALQLKLAKPNTLAYYAIRHALQFTLDEQEPFVNDIGHTASPTNNVYLNPRNGAEVRISSLQWISAEIASLKSEGFWQEV